MVELPAGSVTAALARRGCTVPLPAEVAAIVKFLLSPELVTDHVTAEAVPMLLILAAVSVDASIVSENVSVNSMGTELVDAS